MGDTDMGDTSAGDCGLLADVGVLPFFRCSRIFCCDCSVAQSCHAYKLVIVIFNHSGQSEVGPVFTQ